MQPNRGPPSSPCCASRTAGRQGFPTAPSETAARAPAPPAYPPSHQPSAPPSHVPTPHRAPRSSFLYYTNWAILCISHNMNASLNSKIAVCNAGRRGVRRVVVKEPSPERTFDGEVAPLTAIDGIAIQPTRSPFAVIRRYGTDTPCRKQLVAHAINGILALGG
jgi:hypothetical protein